MRHRNARTKLGRTGAHRKALMRNLAVELIRHERIRTTLVKAKAMRTLVSKVITLAKRQDLAARRHVLRLIPDQETAAKLFNKLGPRYLDRNGGYTRIYQLEPRQGDCAPMAIIELLDREQKPAEPAAPPKAPGIRERLFGSKKPKEQSAPASGS